MIFMKKGLDSKLLDSFIKWFEFN